MATRPMLLEDLVGWLWPELSHTVDDAVLPTFEWEVLRALRHLETAADSDDQTAVVECEAALREVFTGYPRANALLAEAEAAGGVEFRSVRPPAGAVRSVLRPHLIVSVWYATDRRRDDGDQPAFGPDRGEGLSYGIAKVVIPDDHRTGELEKPRRARLKFFRKKEREVRLIGIEPFDDRRFAERSRDALEEAGTRDALLFVHGFNVDFESAARVAAQLVCDVEFHGLPLLYSWPSEGKVLSTDASRAISYSVDAGNTEWTEPHFVEFLRSALSRLGPEQLHVIAHSMGNRVLTRGLMELARTGGLPEGSATLGEVIFAAPDVDAAVFRNRLDQLRGLARGYTLYASKKDRALKLAPYHYPRAGQSGDDLVVVDGLDTVDVGVLDTEPWHHSYFTDNESILSDFFYLLSDLAPDARKDLQPMPHRDGTYWTFRPTRARRR